MSAWSDWKCGAITKSDYAFATGEEARREQGDCEKTCGNCEFDTWDRRDKPCCFCHDYSEFQVCEPEEDNAIILLRD